MPEQPQDDEFDADARRDVGPTADAAAEELAWQSIIDNYGERALLDEAPTEPPVAPPAESAVGPVSDAPFGGRFGDPRALDGYDGEPEDQVAEEVEEEGYVPPEPPPLPRLAPDRAIAWAGIFGSPIVLLLALILSISIPAWLGYLLVTGFVGGFIYLVVQMPREPRDPWDDGAQI